MEYIDIQGAKEHNLKDISLKIPRNAMVVITGVSGSGKSSLAFDTLFREGQVRFLSSLSAYARQFMGKMGRVQADRIQGLSPSLCMNQKTTIRNPRSTVGTLTDINSYLRLLFARLGKGSAGRSSSCFSFNSPAGACEACKGLGVEDRIDPNLLIEDHERSIRQGALKITTPTGYLVYSQVTLDVLDQVCRAHGFNVDIPWSQLTEPQKDIVLNGSQKIKIPYGKHPLENRLKWSGITAKPREEGFYKGILPVMEDILKRDRNKNILRFAKSITCRTCKGSRLKPEALEVTLNQHHFAEVQQMTADDLIPFLRSLDFEPQESSIASQLLEDVFLRLEFMSKLGLAYLPLNRESTQLNAGEAQRLRLVQQAANKLQGVMWVLDEPSIGLHPADRDALLEVLRELCNLGNTVIIVEHDEETMLRADWIVDIGPLAGTAGGRALFSGPPQTFLEGQYPNSATWLYLTRHEGIAVPKTRRSGYERMVLSHARLNHLKSINATFLLGTLNVVTGPSGSGKSCLVHGVLVPALSEKLGNNMHGQTCGQLAGYESLTGITEVDQSPLGKTSRSNPATYTKLFDEIRTLFAKSKDAKEKSLSAKHFSFNTKGGRCETCEGTGSLNIGMHFLADAQVACETCLGKRFKPNVLDVRVKGHNISDVLDMTIVEAAAFFDDHPKLIRTLNTLIDVGLGYLKLGQPSSTLSGGEAQRIRLATHLAKSIVKREKGKQLFIFNEPTTGLHLADIQVLLGVFSRLVETGHTLIVIEHNLDIIKSADLIVDMGPGSGSRGGELVVQGTPEQVAEHRSSKLAPFLSSALMNAPRRFHPIQQANQETSHPIRLQGVETHNLQGIDVDINKSSLTVVCGVSGSGKSSLVFDTLHAESQRLFFQSLSTHSRRYLKQLPRPAVHNLSGLTPSLAIGQSQNPDHPRSLVASALGIDPLLRLLYARFSTGHPHPQALVSSRFSANHHLGACPTCQGLGVQRRCDPAKLVSHPNESLLNGAMKGSKPGRFYGDPQGQYVAILKQIGLELGLDLEEPWRQLIEKKRDIAMHGTGDRVWKATWSFNRKGRTGTHTLETTWPGFCGHIDQEYERVHGDHRGQALLPFMSHQTCEACNGQRLNPEACMARVAGRTLPEVLQMNADRCLQFFSSLRSKTNHLELKTLEAATDLLGEICLLLNHLIEIGLPYLGLDRPINTLSRGERQRLRLAGALAGDMSGITYILDEPSSGLHPRDRQKLLKKIIQLRDQGNTMIVVEHDLEFLRGADEIIDMGPGSGALGGQITFKGTFPELKASQQSQTGTFLRESKRALTGNADRLGDGLTIRNASAHNLNIPQINLPSRGLICVTGVSGSGKSSLLFDVVRPSFERGQAVECDAIEGCDAFDGIFSMDQKLISHSNHSNPLSYSNLFDPLKKWLASNKVAIEAGLKANFFSPFSKQGRCEACRGLGQQKIEMGFLPDVWIQCETCQGRQFKDDVLSVTFRGRSVSDLLQLNVSEAIDVLHECQGLVKGLTLLKDLGLGHLPLGRGLHTLSGGEAQRLKLAKILLEPKSEEQSYLFLFDEPSNGLHFLDIENLVSLLRSIINRGHSVVVIEHNLQLIAASDWVIDLGPEGGQAGGQLLFSGTPSNLISMEQSATGHHLKAWL